MIPAGAPVLISLLSANRDEARFADPQRFDIGRTPNPHLAFGHGIHYCLGAPLARLEAQVVFASLLARHPNMQLAEPPDRLVWRRGVLGSVAGPSYRAVRVMDAPEIWY